MIAIRPVRDYCELYGIVSQRKCVFYKMLIIFFGLGNYEPCCSAKNGKWFVLLIYEIPLVIAYAKRKVGLCLGRVKYYR